MDAEHERVIETKSGTYRRRCLRIGPKASLVIELGGERVVVRATSRANITAKAENRERQSRTATTEPTSKSYRKCQTISCGSSRRTSR